MIEVRSDPTTSTGWMWRIGSTCVWNGEDTEAKAWRAALDYYAAA